MNNLDYCEVVCNFLNNTKGCIENNEIRFLLEVLFEYDIEENELREYLSHDLKDKINKDIECDKSNDLYEDLYNLYKEIRKEENEYLLEVQNKYDKYLMKTENRGISYGEIAYLQSLSKEQLEEIEKEIDKEWHNMLENILIDYFGLQKEKEKENWYNCYNKLISLIYDLGELGVLDNVNIIVDKLDNIDNIEE